LYDLKREHAGPGITLFSIDEVVEKTGRSHEIEARALGLLAHDGLALEHDGRYSITQMGEDVVAAGEQPLYPVI